MWRTYLTQRRCSIKGAIDASNRSFYFACLLEEGYAHEPHCQHDELSFAWSVYKQAAITGISPAKNLGSGRDRQSRKPENPHCSLVQEDVPARLTIPPLRNNLP